MNRRESIKTGVALASSPVFNVPVIFPLVRERLADADKKKILIDALLSAGKILDAQNIPTHGRLIMYKGKVISEKDFVRDYSGEFHDENE